MSVADNSEKETTGGYLSSSSSSWFPLEKQDDKSSASVAQNAAAAMAAFEEFWEIQKEYPCVSFEAWKKLPFVHSGYMGLGPLFLQDRKWVEILRTLMPEVFWQVAQSVLPQKDEWHALMKWAENNPVVAAFGTLLSARPEDKTASSSSLSSWTLLPLEWDVFVDPAFCQQVGTKLQQFDKKDVVKWVQNCLNETENVLWIAHGTVLHWVMANLGLAPQRNYNSILRASATKGGGMSARRWVATYAVACEMGLGKCQQWQDKNKNNNDLVTFLETASLEESTRRLQQATLQPTKAPCLSLYLDIRSRGIPTAVWGPLLQALYESGIPVVAAGCFAPEDVRGIGKAFGEDKKFQEILCFHSVGGLQQACLAGTLQRNEAVMVNAGSLLSQPPSVWDVLAIAFGWRDRRSNDDEKEKQDPYKLLPLAQCRSRNEEKTKTSDDAGSTLQDFKEHYQFSLGLYCQEYDMNDGAMQLLAQHVNANSHVFDIGFAWGGRNGRTLKFQPQEQGPPNDGFGVQRYLGHTWDPLKHPAPNPN